MVVRGLRRRRWVLALSAAAAPVAAAHAAAAIDHGKMPRFVAVPYVICSGGRLRLHHEHSNFSLSGGGPNVRSVSFCWIRRLIEDAGSLYDAGDSTLAASAASW